MPADSAWIDDVIGEVGELRPLGDKVVFVSGNFNIVHPGHLRLLNFAAECGDLLVVGVYADGVGHTLLPEQLRLDGVASIGVVDYAFILPEPPDRLIRQLRPSVVVKGREHEKLVNSERDAVASYGGTLLFSSGETGFSSLDLLRQEIYETRTQTVVKPADFPNRHGFTIADLADTVRKFADLKVVVIGDLIVDEYISCDALGMSQEDPTLVVSPIAHDRFVGGAGIVAAHARGIGAHVRYFTVVGADQAADFAREKLGEYQVKAEFLTDTSRPTTLKQRYRVGDKTLLRVSHLRQHDISTDLVEGLYERIRSALDDADLVIFSDFNYGVLPQILVDRVAADCRQLGVMMVADSQASSQISDVSRFKGMALLTPTEREARLAMRDTRAGLVVLAEDLLNKAEATHIVMTLGAEGILIFSPGAGGPFHTDQLPAMNTAPRDVSGAGDSLLTCTAIALAAGADIWRASYLGAIAAACQVGRLGNIPLTVEQIVGELSQ